MRVHMRGGGKLRSFADDDEGIRQAFEALRQAGKGTIFVQNQGVTLMLQPGGGGFRFRLLERKGHGGPGYRQSVRRDYDADEARRVLKMFVMKDATWRTHVEWRKSLFDLPVAILAPATLAVCTAVVMGVLALTGGLEGWSWRYLPNLVVGVSLIGGVIGYTDWFFSHLRRRLAVWLGKQFGVRIVESMKLGFFPVPACGTAPMAAWSPT